MLIKEPWITAQTAAVARERSHAPGYPLMEGNAGCVASSSVQPMGDMRFRRSGQSQRSQLGIDRLSVLIPNPTIQTAHESADKRAVKGPYPWRPPV